MLKQRVVTAVCLTVSFLGILFFLPPAFFSICILLATLVAAWEWASLSGFTKAWQQITYQLVIGSVLFFLAWYFEYPSANIVQTNVLAWVLFPACAWWIFALYLVYHYPDSASLWGGRIARAVMGGLVLWPTAVGFVYLREQPEGAWWILLVVTAVACADIGAYFFGKAYGRHKLARRVSPGKTWEGVAGGLVCNLLLTLGVALIIGEDRWVALALMLLPTSLASVLGDLQESMVKRHCGVKDSSCLLPGHGGLMDRLDSLTAAVPVFATAFMLMNWQPN